MSDIPIVKPGKPMEQPSEDLSKVMGQLSVISNETSKSSKNLSDMPFDVVCLIIERSKYKEQLILRKTSKSLRALVDKQKPACKSVEVYCCMKSVDITFNNQWVMYRSLDYECEPYTRIIVKRDDFMKFAFDDLASILKNPKLQLEKFGVYYENSEKYCNEIRKTLESLNHQVSVKHFELEIYTPSTLLSILPFLKPGVLERISLDLSDEDDWSTGMDQVALLEQWKQAEELELEGCQEMSNISTGDPGKPMKLPHHDLSGPMTQLSVTRDNSDNS
ncbi:unnamed protein product [Caenorhabditis brenneri]